MGEIFLAVFLIGLLPTLAIASTIGLLVARRARDRIEEIGTVLGALTNGYLGARVAVSGEVLEHLSRIGLAVNRMAQAQEASIASLRQVSADIAHDLKTPIQRVAVLLDKLASKTALSRDQKLIFDAALDDTDRIVKTFHALLQIAEIEGGDVRDLFGPVELREIAEDVVDVYGPAAEESGHRLAFRVSGSGSFTVRGDRHLLTQVIANLIENALRHTPRGCGIEVGVVGAQNSVEMSVRDDGPGIPAGERGQVLRRLYRLERSRTSDGSGLGLSLVAAVCGLHKARLELNDNAPGLAIKIIFLTREE